MKGEGGKERETHGRRERNPRGCTLQPPPAVGGGEKFSLKGVILLDRPQVL